MSPVSPVSPKPATPATPARKAQWRKTRSALFNHAMSLPEAYEDHPWGETVVKVNKKIFLFLGVDDGSHAPGFGVKLPESRDQALAVPDAEPSGYGLGKAGWVSVRLESQLPPIDVLKDWVEESYRAVAPKKLVHVLEDRNPG
jgi:predicted DNA-binding protein (MmcQ/YjbR family)